MTDTIHEFWLAVMTMLGLAFPTPAQLPDVVQLPDIPVVSPQQKETPPVEVSPASNNPVKCRLDRGADGKTLVAWASSDVGSSGTYILVISGGSSLNAKPKGRFSIDKGETARLVSARIDTDREVSAVLTLEWKGGTTNCNLT